MKATLTILLHVAVFMLFLLPNSIAQKKQYKARLSVDYINVMGTAPYLEVATKFKGEDGYEPCVNLDLQVYQQLAEDSLVKAGSFTTNKEGVGRFELKKKEALDTLNHTFIIKIEGDDTFKNAKKVISFRDTNLEAKMVEIDNVANIKILFVDGLGMPIENAKIKVNLQRLFAPLPIGKSYKTNSKGEALVPLIETYPGVDGKLLFEIYLDNKKYGIVKYMLEAPIGQHIQDISTFDDSTMWSPPGKTPLFLLVFPNLLLLGIWLVILLLVRNMYKIYKC